MNPFGVVIGTFLVLIIISFIMGLILPLFCKQENRKNRTVKWARLILLLLPIPLLLLMIVGVSAIFIVCDGREIERFEIGSLPDNLVYFVGESDALDLTGGTLLVITRDTPGICGPRREEWSETPMYRQSPFHVVYDIDFSIPGEHEVFIIWLDHVQGSFTIEVIEPYPDAIESSPVPEYITIRGEQFCTSLTELELRDLVVSWRDDWKNEDIIPLRYMTNLTTLVLWNISISDITPLAELTNLTELTMSGNEISDLEELSLFANDINDVSPLSNLTNLTRLNLEHNQVSDISALANLTKLEDLALNGNIITDISALANMIYLRSLFLDGNEVSDLSPLANLTNMEHLWLRYNEIRDISPLANLVNLESLSLLFNEVSDITPLSNHNRLEFLCVGNNQVYDWSPVEHVDFVSGRPFYDG